MRTQRGFTLLEILISMSLFTLIGFGVVMLMRSGISMWNRGNRGALQEDRLEQSLPRLEEDLRQTLPSAQIERRPFDPENPDPEKIPEPLPPENRFVSGYQVYKIRDVEYRCRYLAFVRDIRGLAEIETYAVRAGTNARAESYIDGRNDEEEFAKNDHLPTGGQVEVLWIWLPDEDEVGLGTVYRAYRTPIGGQGTLLDPKNFDEMEELKAIDPLPMFQNVLLFDLYFWTQWTTTWEWNESDPTVTGPPQSPEEIRQGRPTCGPSRTWDSTRGLLEKEGPLGFKLSRGKESLNFHGDDIWPRMVRVAFALREEETALGRAIGATDQEFTTVVSDFATGRGDLYDQLFKVGSEWIRLTGRDPSRRDMFRVAQRGRLGTEAVAHPAETPVYYGRVFDFTISIPAFRDDNN